MEILILLIAIAIAVYISTRLYKRKLMRQVLLAVVQVRLGICRRLQIQYTSDYGLMSGKLAAAVSNRLFMGEPTNAEARQFLQSNEGLIAAEFERIKENQHMREAVTRAVMADAVAYWGLGGSRDNNLINDQIFNLEKEGILVADLGSDNPTDFIAFAAEYYAERNNILQEEGQSLLANGDNNDSIGPDEIVMKFHSYCKLFLEMRCNLQTDEASLLLLDPELGKVMDKEKQEWLFGGIIPDGIDIEELLEAKQFDNSVMKQINDVLRHYAKQFPDRQESIVEYLNSIGYFDS